MNIRFYNASILSLKDGFEIKSGEVWVFDHLIGYVGDRLENNIKWDREINLAGNLIMPGFKNAHTHSAMTFLRSWTNGLMRKFFRWKLNLHKSTFTLSAKLPLWNISQAE